jgi:amino acid permease
LSIKYLFIFDPSHHQSKTYQNKLFMSLLRKKSLASLLTQAANSEKGLKRTLGAGNLIALGVGAIIGAGLFVRTAAAAGEARRPAVTVSFIVAAIGCVFAGLCYAEFAVHDPHRRQRLHLRLRHSWVN